MKQFEEQTIAALATPAGRSSIAVIRLSGRRSLRILKKCFRSNHIIKSHKLILGKVIHRHKLIDQVMAVFMKKPNSYTGEDVVEISCHGNLAVINKILKVLFSCGARPAEKGEFTKRAFLNNKIDLAEAEALIDLINAKTYKAVKIALDTLGGSLSIFVDNMRKKLCDMLSAIEANIDFSDDVKTMKTASMKSQLNRIREELYKAIQSAGLEKVYTNGVRAVIVGKANVGKSSLLNALLGEERSIVTNMPGTTRDVLEETIDLNGIPVRLVDTAGISQPKNLAEKIGIDKAKEQMSVADVALVVLDKSRRMDKQDLKILKGKEHGQAIVVVNKNDLPDKLRYKKRQVRVSAITGQGIPTLKRAIYNKIKRFDVDEIKSKFLVNERQKKQLETAKQSLDNAIKTCQNNAGLECLAIDIKNAIIALGEITGEQVSEEVINQIFDRFCVGK